VRSGDYDLDYTLHFTPSRTSPGRALANGWLLCFSHVARYFLTPPLHSRRHPLLRRVCLRTAPCESRSPAGAHDLQSSSRSSWVLRISLTAFARNNERPVATVCDLWVRVDASFSDLSTAPAMFYPVGDVHSIRSYHQPHLYGNVHT
jgi:hypothetical protein